MFQQIQLIGNLGSEPEMRYTAGGTPVTNFSLATSKKISKERTEECPKGWKESYNGKAWELVTWWRITCWRGLAETTNEYLAKGKQVFVQGEISGTAENGSLNPNVWEGKDGVHRASFELTASNVKFLGGGNGSSASTPQDDDAPPLSGGEDIKLPF